MSKQLIIWQFTDKKTGHENQANGLIGAMADLTSIKRHTIDVSQNLFQFLLALISGRFYRQLSTIVKPAYLICAGGRSQRPKGLG